jgi:hypothetical protein
MLTLVKPRTMGSHEKPGTGAGTWLTPPALIEALGSFDLDPCAGPVPRPWPTAFHHIALPENGLDAEWFGRVWLNPPYSVQAVKWLRRMVNHGVGTALVHARTETAWFVETVWHSADAVLFLEGRITFHHRDGRQAAGPAGAPSCLVAYGRRDARALASAGLRGTFVRL